MRGSGKKEELRKCCAQELLKDHRYNFVKDEVKSLFCHSDGRVLREARTREFSAGRKLCFSRQDSGYNQTGYCSFS